jgi:cytochrome oxidase Cu insertion factor (SCO1/SenC/PrrC family)
MTPTLTGIFALAVVISTMTVWLRKVGQVNIPKNRMLFHIAMGTAIAAGAYAWAAGAHWVGNTAATLAIVIACFYFVLRAQSAQSRTPPAISIGEHILDFTAQDDEGKDFQLASLRGTPFLLKFFRGHW